MKLIEKGILNKTINSKSEAMEYKMGFIGEEHLEEILSLQKKVSEDLGDNEIFVEDSREFILNEVLALGKGVAMGVFVCDKLVAFRTISLPLPDSEYNLAREVGLSENETDKVAILEATVVHTDFRGNRLQKKMLNHSIELLQKQGYRYICATVSPYNYPSLSTVMSFNLTIRDLKIREGIYDGKLRFLLVRDLAETVNNNYDEVARVLNTDIAKQHQFLKEGFIGFEISKKENCFEIKYGMREGVLS